MADEIERLRVELAKFAQGVKIRIPTDTMEQEFQTHYRRGYEAGKAERDALRCVIDQAARILRGEGVEDQGEAYDKAQQLLDAALREKP
jgi:hypothetical protein